MLLDSEDEWDLFRPKVKDPFSLALKSSSNLLTSLDYSQIPICTRYHLPQSNLFLNTTNYNDECIEGNSILLLLTNNCRSEACFVIAKKLRLTSYTVHLHKKCAKSGCVKAWNLTKFSCYRVSGWSIDPAYSAPLSG